MESAQLTAHDGTGFAISIVGYQFPQTEEGDDANWLLVRVAVRHPKGSWNVTSPCLLTYDVARLADWLDGISRGREVDSELGFLELCLEFEFHEGESRSVRIRFDLELRPPWIDDAEEVELVLPVDQIDLRGAVESLRRQLAAFPQRAKAK